MMPPHQQDRARQSQQHSRNQQAAHRFRHDGGAIGRRAQRRAIRSFGARLHSPYCTLRRRLPKCGANQSRLRINGGSGYIIVFVFNGLDLDLEMHPAMWGFLSVSLLGDCPIGPAANGRQGYFFACPSLRGAPASRGSLQPGHEESLRTKCADFVFISLDRSLGWLYYRVKAEERRWSRTRWEMVVVHSARWPKAEPAGGFPTAVKQCLLSTLSAGTVLSGAYVPWVGF